MQSGFDREGPSPRLVVCHARPEAFVPFTRSILARLGYALVSPEEWVDSPAYAAREPDLRIVDERRLEELPPADRRGTPVLLLTGRQGVRTRDRRVVGAVLRPAGLHELYRLLQRTLEARPRSVPRVETRLPARIRHREREWAAWVRSLSENGCLLESPERLPLGAELEISFGLPGRGSVKTRAASTYELPPATGLVFHATPPAIRVAIAAFVEGALQT